jgi:hypothetical protein
MLRDAQIWLVAAIDAHSPVATIMQSAWAWPIVESLHFIGLCLLIGAIGSFDLRLLGIARRVPIAAMHRFIPWGIAGFALNVATGLLFVLTEPDQYIYNPSFHLKVVFLIIAGVNASLFYVTSYREVFGAAPSLDAPRRAKAIALVSLCAWMTVIVCGRLITFYRPGPCDGPRGVLLTCEPE